LIAAILTTVISGKAMVIHGKAMVIVALTIVAVGEIGNGSVW
jgi:hypothetical protein